MFDFLRCFIEQGSIFDKVPHWPIAVGRPDSPKSWQRCCTDSCAMPSLQLRRNKAISWNEPTISRRRRARCRVVPRLCGSPHGAHCPCRAHPRWQAWIVAQADRKAIRNPCFTLAAHPVCAAQTDMHSRRSPKAPRRNKLADLADAAGWDARRKPQS